MLEDVKNRIRRLLPQPLKDRVKTALGRPLGFLHEDWRILERVGQTTTPHVVLDVGAHHGWFAHCWLNWCRSGVVHAFEPTPASFQRIQELYGADPRIRPVQVGVGAEPGRLKLQVHADASVCNSFLPVKEETWNRIDYRHGAVSECEVDVITLDDYCAGAGIDAIRLIKIDVQGFERQVLEGARHTLARTDFVLVEAGILKLYEEHRPSPRSPNGCRRMVFTSTTCARGTEAITSWWRPTCCFGAMTSPRRYRRRGIAGMSRCVDARAPRRSRRGRFGVMGGCRRPRSRVAHG